MKRLEGQIVASTRLDAHGTRLAEGELRAIFDDMPDPVILNKHHDLSQEPAGRLLNKRLERLESGDLAIVIDAEILDETALDWAKGFSLSFPSNIYSVDASRRGNIAVVFNPRILDEADFIPLVGLSDDNFQIDVVELQQRSVEAAAIVILKFVGLAAVSHFVGQFAERAAKALAASLRDAAAKRRNAIGQETVFQLQFEMEIGGKEVPVVLSVLPENLTQMQDDAVSIDAARVFVETKVGNSKLQRIALRFSGSPPTFEIDHFVDMRGNVVAL
ncbi:MAG: hypothetical protein AAFP18_11295 [Bacteroidota bacterium]